VTLYSMLTSRFEFHVEIDGEAKTLTDGEMRSYFYSPDPEVRKRVFQEMCRVVSAETGVLSQIYANRVRDWHNEYVELRGVASPISMRNLSNDVPDAAVKTLLDVVHQNAPLFQDYFRLKAGWLGMERLRRYDIYAPLASSHPNVNYPDAAERVLDLVVLASLASLCVLATDAPPWLTSAAMLAVGMWYPRRAGHHAAVAAVQRVHRTQ
jgi:oligoendopeptidase F